MSSRSKTIIFVLLTLLLFSISYARDTLFILLNAAIDKDPINYANTPIPDLLKDMSLSDLKKLKWVMAIVFSALFMLISTFSIHFFFRNRYFTRLTVIIYLVLGAAGLGSELLKYTVKLTPLVSRIAHVPETIIQSPLVLLLIFSSLLVYSAPTNK